MSEREIFLAALEIKEPTGRERFLLEQFPNDDTARQRVMELLQAADKVGSFLEVPAAREGVTSAFTAPVDLTGTVVAGKYKLREKLGEGGMGSVWVADQSEPVQRRVALKLIKINGDSRSMLARFEQERQALALMDHPNIAKVFDAGVDSPLSRYSGRGDGGEGGVGTPYFVMELIKGVPLTKYCDDAKLSMQQRLELFIPVCQAVQHAHQKGVIHRDLKPGNILIGLYDGKPVPKVIDFGVAKATGSRLTDQTIYTEVGSLVGTLEYMSPEQAELNNLDIDTRSDIYALGVLLYELLTGSVPFARKEMVKAGLGEMLRVIKEVEPPKPSTKLSGSGTLPSIAANRHTEPAKLTRLVKGDLDWIVMKALEKDRNRRYETANGFAADVQRYLSGEAVTAVPPSAGYRLRKFVKRNKGTVVAASLILVTLLSGFIVSSYAFYRADINRQQAEGAQKSALEQWKRAEDQKANALRSAEREAEERKKADAAKVEAQAKEAEANAVVAFFENKVFAAARPKGQEGGLGAGVTLRDAIAASVPSLDKVFAAQPMVEARLRMALGNTFRYLAEYEQARAQDERARALYTRHRGPEHWDTLHSMNNLANSLRALNRHADALKLREETLAIQTRVLPRDHPATLLSMQNLANNYNALNRHADAIKLYEETLAIMKRVLPPEYPGTLKGMNNLSVSYAAVNRQADALKLREEVLAIQKRVLPKDHPDTLLSMHNLANSYGALNRPAEALKLREETLAIQKRVLPPDHPDTLLSMNNLADSYAGLNRHAEALKLHKETLAIRQRVLPQDHPDTLLSMLNLANSLIQLDRGAEALPLLDEFLAKAPASPALDPRQIPRAFSLRIRYFQKTGDAAGCRATAEMRETLNRTDADSLYDAACYRAVTGVVQVRRPGVDSARLAREDADRAMQWLHKAVRAGHKDTALMKKDHDLDSLREREDFKKLLAELENGAEKK